jgi:hypothetical protein
MSKNYRVLVFIISFYLLLPAIASASTQKTLTGVVTAVTNSGITFTNGTAAKYSAELSAATLMRKNGAPMQFKEVIAGDKIKVIGTLWNDNSFSVVSLTDLSLYAHNSSFTGKITSINTTNSSFTMQSKAYGTQTIYTNSFTSFSMNGSIATFKDLALGMTEKVKGQWDRTNSQIVASTVAETYRLISIYFTGSLSMQTGSSITVIGNGNVIYGVDLSKATLLSKNNLSLLITDLKPGQLLRVWGKHLSGSVQIAGVKVVDSSVTK